MKRREGLTKIQRDEALLTSMKERLFGKTSLECWCGWRELDDVRLLRRCNKMTICEKTKHLCYRPKLGYFYHVFCCALTNYGILWSPTDEQYNKFMP